MKSRKEWKPDHWDEEISKVAYEEYWRVCNDYPNYEVSTFGRIRNIKTKRILRPYPNNVNYVRVMLKKPKNMLIHRLVANVWYGMPLESQFEVNHIDCNVENNFLHNLNIMPSEDNAKAIDWLDQEEWKVAPNTETWISSLGRVKNKQGKFILWRIRQNGRYFQVGIKNFALPWREKNQNKPNYFPTLHKLVYETFIGEKKEGLTIDHKNGCRFDNRPSNLEQITLKENIKRAKETRLKYDNRQIY